MKGQEELLGKMEPRWVTLGGSLLNGGRKLTPALPPASSVPQGALCLL